MPYEYRYLFKVFCGPTIVQGVAERLSRNYMHIKTIGTEHVYVETNYEASHILRILGPTWRPCDVVQLRDQPNPRGN